MFGDIPFGLSKNKLGPSINSVVRTEWTNLWTTQIQSVSLTCLYDRWRHFHPFTSQHGSVDEKRITGTVCVWPLTGNFVYEPTVVDWGCLRVRGGKIKWLPVVVIQCKGYIAQILYRILFAGSCHALPVFHIYGRVCPPEDAFIKHCTDYPHIVCSKA